MSFSVVSLSIDDPRYPTSVRDLPGAPRILYCRGNLDLLNQPSVAVIGSRETTPHAGLLATEFGHLLPELGYVVVSGLARGIDAAGHRGCLDNAGGHTIAVLVDIERIYPSEHRELANQILHTGGLLVSEHPAGASRASSFPFKPALFQRDRIQAGLSRAVIAVQCGRGSGTLHTVSFAEKYGRPVLVPRISRAEYNTAPTRYEGSVDLIRSGRGIPFVNLEQAIAALGE